MTRLFASRKAAGEKKFSTKINPQAS